MHFRKLAYLVVLSFAVSCLSSHRYSRKVHRNIPSAKVILIDVVNGSIDVRKSVELNEIVVDAEIVGWGFSDEDAKRNAEKAKLTVMRLKGDTVYITVDFDRNSKVKADLSVAVPIGTEVVSAKCVNGTIKTVGHFDMIDLDLVNGSAKLDGGGGNLKVSVVNGSVLGTIDSLLSGGISVINGKVSIELVDVSNIGVTVSNAMTNKINLEGFDEISRSDEVVKGVIGSGIGSKLKVEVNNGQVYIKASKSGSYVDMPKEKLGRVDSNHHRQIQNLVSCRLDDAPVKGA